LIIKRAYNVKGFEVGKPFVRLLKVLISPELQEVKNICVGMTLLPPGSKSSDHIHEKGEETWYILSGRGKVIVDGEEEEVSSDTVVVIMPGQKHQLVNTGDETFKVLWMHTPPGAEKPVLTQEQV